MNPTTTCDMPLELQYDCIIFPTDKSCIDIDNINKKQLDILEFNFNVQHNHNYNNELELQLASLLKIEILFKNELQINENKQHKIIISNENKNDNKINDDKLQLQGSIHNDIINSNWYNEYYNNDSELKHFKTWKISTKIKNWLNDITVSDNINMVKNILYYII